MNANRLHTTPPRNARGFSLMELMVVVIIIGVLAAIAVPGYQNYMRESRRSIGATALTELAARMERFFSDNNTYATATIGGGGGDIYPSWAPSDGPQANSYYTIVLTVQTAVAWTAQARPINQQVGDGTIQLASTGIRNYDSSSDVSITAGAHPHWNW